MIDRKPPSEHEIRRAISHWFASRSFAAGAWLIWTSAVLLAAGGCALGDCKDASIVFYLGLIFVPLAVYWAVFLAWKSFVKAVQWRYRRNRDLREVRRFL